CHTEDVVIKTDGTKVDVSGGWHDAGDYGKWIGGGTSGVLALAIFQEQFQDDFKSSGVPELTDEAVWEARYFCKGYWDGAFHPGFTGNFENVCEWLGAPECEPPRIVFEKEMIENNYGPVKSPGVSLTGASLAIVAQQIKSYNEEFAKKCIAIAEDAYDIDSKVELDENKLNSFLGLQTGLLFSDVELYKITKDKKYKEDAKIRVKNITKQQIKGREGFFHPDEAKKSEGQADCRFQMLALYQYHKTFPESELNKEIKNTFKRWADYMMKYADVSSFGLIGGVTKDGTIKSYRYVAGANRRIGAVAWGLATAAIILDEPKYLEAAELQLQWIIGFNPADISMMATVGKGPGCYHHRYAFMEGCEDGIVPGGILNGIMPGKGEPIEIGDITKNFIIADLPPEYPIIDKGVWGWTFAYLTNEYWTRNNSWFVLGAMQIEKAMRELKK
ncbi:MAG: glycoside hydrolase family 9 protein, partial [Bacteroidales bacterium]|nr:glycoside hydrolase family 9 protein [Bacteroidales bacterium]